MRTCAAKVQLPSECRISHSSQSTYFDAVALPVVPGAGGARKLRRPDPLSGKGKSGGYRVLYAFLPLHGTVLLIAAWPKSEREYLERDDYKAIGKIIAHIQTHLDQGRSL